MRISYLSSDVCSSDLRFSQDQLTNTFTPFGTQLSNFKEECDKLEKTAKSAGHESIRILIPRALNFLYTLRNKRGIGHESGDVDANEIDAATAVRIADWCVCALIRVYYPISLQEAQRSDEHTSELQSIMRTSYAVF